MPKITSNPRRVRLASGLTQQQFWSRLKVTQGGGSRYESGRPMPPPLQALFTIAHGRPEEAAKVVNQVRGTIVQPAALTIPQPKIRRTAGG